MASPSLPPPILLRLCLLLSLLSLSAAGRPCKTFFISSYSFSVNPSTTATDPSNPSLSFRNPHFSSGFVAIFAETGPNKPSSAEISFDRRFFPVPHRSRERVFHSLPADPARFASDSPYDFSSLRERTKDILSVVVALLFGVGCGGLTAATMYLAWSVFFNRYEYRNSFEDYADEVEEFAGDAKKTGYQKIPADAPAKEAA